MEATLSDNTQMKTVVYDDGIVRAFSVITIIWGVVAFLVGVIVAAQLSFWQAQENHWPGTTNLPLRRTPWHPAA